MVYEFKFPDVGEGITEGEIVKWLVNEGDKVKENDNIVQVETDKAVVDLPSPKSGKVLKLNFKEGDTVKVGQTLLVIDDGSMEEMEKPKERKSVSVVGYLEEAKEVMPPPKEITTQEIQHDNVLAVPRIRNLAKKLNVDITKVKATGPNGRILEDDVINASKGILIKEVNLEISETKPKIVKKYDMWGYLERIQLKGTRKTIAKNMLYSSQNVAAVTSMIDVDVTKLWDIREKEKTIAEKKGIKLTFLPYIIKAVIESLKTHPYLNSEIAEDEIILKKYYNIGIAVDTDYGLLVPVIKRAETKDIFQLAAEISDLSTKAKERKLDIMDLKGGSFTITNYGSITGNYGTPIINYPEAAILGIGRIFDKVALVNGKLENRKTLPLSLTFDHRILDGAEAARFLNDLVKYLENPDLIK